MRCAIIHYHELALKGRNRPFFEQRLVKNLRLVLRDLGVRQVDALHGRIRVALTDDTPWEAVSERLGRVFGIAHYSLAHSVPMDLAHPSLEALKLAIGREVAPLTFDTFRVSTKRADKRFPFTSVDVDREIGAHLCRLTGKKVSLGRPELTVQIELLTKAAYYSTKKEAGSGGLPVGISGKVACCISGGIDSPVAAYRMM
ncbi:MAG: tRNA 4-thiouridine(8) synthase ThiI, partial [Nitrospirota bacterium]|nr:tRNA 4-thiouridine(8) synthase ThiI [Nitrospirota bacterium]